MKLDIIVDVTEAEDWMAVAGRIGDIFRVHSKPLRLALAVQEDDPSKDIEKHILKFSLDGASILTHEQQEFFKTHKHVIQFSE